MIRGGQARNSFALGELTMRTSTHVFGALAGIVAALALEGWTTLGVRSATHYAAVDRAATTPKAIALAFYRMAYDEDKPQQAAEMYLGGNFAYHADGISSANAGQWISETSGSPALLQRTTEQVAADGDIVMVRYVLKSGGASSRSGVDTFRIQDHRIVELWTVRDAHG
jgi:predicted SnoaL-like aldol condensation-catalyzing enzyme